MMSSEEIPSIKLGSSQVLFFTEKVPLEDVVNQMAESLEVLDYVKDSFSHAVLEREQVFPTGLPTKPIGIAIPHTDAEHVNSDAIAIGILKEPVQFEEMGTSGGSTFVDVSIITMLAISNPSQMIPLLSQLAKSYQDGDFLNSLYNEDRVDMIMNKLKEKIPQIEITG